MKISKSQAIEILWRKGRLEFLLDKNQKELYELYCSSKEKINVWLLSRRTGKTHSLIVFSLMTCITHPKSIVNYLTSTKLQSSSIIRPLIEKILETCPDDIKPTFIKHDYIYHFPNGSELRLAGADAGHAEKLRGGDSLLSIVDEAGSVKDLAYIVKSILLPTTLMTKGKIILSGTPPKESEHDFLTFMETAQAKSTLVRKTIYDNPRLTPEDVQDAIDEQGGEHTEGFQREYLCKIIKDSNTSVIPEFTEELEKSIVKEWPRPNYIDRYVAMDLGYNDLTAVLFAYYDFRAAKIIIEDEIIMDFTQANNNLPTLIEKIRQKERELWTDLITGEVITPVARVSDINPIVTDEIARASRELGYEIYFQPARKDDRDAALNNFKVLLASKKIIISPKCKNFLLHLRNVKWASATNHTKFARSEVCGHYDAVDAGIYLTRSIDYNKNPYPIGYDLNLVPNHHTIRNEKQFYSQNTRQVDVFKKLFPKSFKR